ncbi:MAG: hypothetical protein M1824_000409 [Vezdaea acicularis]|nr:MAG: hypothetical protein M1824_000409 [Vezdaea acicularis]
MASHGYRCGCYYLTLKSSVWERVYLPQIELSAHTKVLSTSSRTVLTQCFINPSSQNSISEACYTFPMYDGVSVVGFNCKIGSRLLTGIVKEKEKAKAIFEKAIEQGETAGLLEQAVESSDIFTTKIGNIPAGEKVIVQITYIGELKHDAEVDGIRFTIPTAIAPRYGSSSAELSSNLAKSSRGTGGIKIVVDVMMDEETFVRGMQSSTHPIAVTMGNTSTTSEEAPAMNKASAMLSLGSTELDKDFVISISAKETTKPIALLETHPHIAGQRALAVSLVPKFQLPPSRPEIVFIADRSGSMHSNIPTLVSALKVFLKSIPIGVKFNICSFGSSHKFLWPKSKAYDESSLKEAMRHVEKFSADFGGTEMFTPVKATLENRYRDLSLEVMLLTDGEIYNQQELFSYLNKEIIESEAPIRVFTLGIGDGVSHSLIEGIARAGNGFSQVVNNGEKMDGKVVRMLKGALSPHVTNYSLEVKYDSSADDGFELIAKVTDELHILMSDSLREPEPAPQKPISLFDENITENNSTDVSDSDGMERFSHLPSLTPPKLMQAPNKIPPLFPFSRTMVYLLMSPDTVDRTPRSVILKGHSARGPLELEIPVQILQEPGETFHQLAAKKAVQELEEGRGWVFDAKDEGGVPLKERFESKFHDMVQREAVRLGVEFQVGGKWCSFVAAESNVQEIEDRLRRLNDEKERAEKRQNSKVLSGDGDSTEGLFTPSSSGSAAFKSESSDLDTTSSARSMAQLTENMEFDNNTSSSNDMANDTASIDSSVISSGTLLSTSTGAIPRSALRLINETKYHTLTRDSNVKFRTNLMEYRQQQQAQPPDVSTRNRLAASGGGAVKEFRRGGSIMPQFQSAPVQVPGRTAGNPYSGAPSGSPYRVGKAGSLLADRSGMNSHYPPAPAAPISASHLRHSLSFGVGGGTPTLSGTPFVEPNSGIFEGTHALDSANFDPVEFEDEGHQPQPTGGYEQRIPLASHEPSTKGGVQRKKKGYQSLFANSKKSVGNVSSSGWLGRKSPSAPAPAPPAPAPAPKPSTDLDRMHVIIALQSFVGSWTLTNELLETIQVSSQASQRGLARISTDLKGVKDEDVIWATVLAIAFLQKRLAKDADSWELVVEKAMGWLEGSMTNIDEWLTEAKAVVMGA